MDGQNTHSAVVLGICKVPFGLLLPHPDRALVYGSRSETQISFVKAVMEDPTIDPIVMSVGTPGLANGTLLSGYIRYALLLATATPVTFVEVTGVQYVSAAHATESLIDHDRHLHQPKGKTFQFVEVMEIYATATAWGADALAIQEGRALPLPESGSSRAETMVRIARKYRMHVTRARALRRFGEYMVAENPAAPHETKMGRDLCEGHPYAVVAETYGIGYPASKKNLKSQPVSVPVTTPTVPNVTVSIDVALDMVDAHGRGILRDYGGRHDCWSVLARRTSIEELRRMERIGRNYSAIARALRKDGTVGYIDGPLDGVTSVLQHFDPANDPDPVDPTDDDDGDDNDDNDD